jgi:hypothetical protein
MEQGVTCLNAYPAAFRKHQTVPQEYLDVTGPTGTGSVLWVFYLIFLFVLDVFS